MANITYNDGELESDVTLDDDLDEGADHAAKTSSGLDENVAGALSYLFGFVTGLIFFLTEEENEFVRFHAAQSTITFGGLVAMSVLLGTGGTALAAIPVVGWMAAIALGVVSLLLAPIGLVLWTVLMYKAYTGSEYELPLVGSYARRYV